MENKDPEEYEGLTIYYETQERAFAPGAANGWPAIIPAPHTKNGRLRRMSPDECRRIMAAVDETKKEARCPG